jgi:UDP-glucuronate decarboxylase
MKALITGGSGFIGSHLCKLLLSKNYQVVCVDNLSSGKIENIKHLTNHKNFQFIKSDVIKALDIECDEIYNLACPASPIKYQHEPISTMKSNIYGSINCLDLAQKYSAKIFQASTSEIYGDPSISPQHEKYWGNVNPIGSRSCYDEGKRAAETLFFDYNKQHNINVKVMRIFNTYGPKMLLDDGRVVSNFICQALTDNDITVYGNGSQTRSFCYIDDLINAIYQFMNTKNDFTGPVNIGNPNEMTINKLANMIIEMTNSKSQLVFKDLPEDDPVQRSPDITLAKKKLNWSPKVGIEEGLQKTISYFENLIRLNYEL